MLYADILYRPRACIMSEDMVIFHKRCYINSYFTLYCETLCIHTLATSHYMEFQAALSSRGYAGREIDAYTK